MPQIFPMNWNILIIYFLIIIIISMSMIYFIYNPKFLIKNNKVIFLNKFWKW
uniref:ATP synthase F0 subunit 8 n=1 Tax=Alectorobius fonsecai TaxID=656181 RepID=UPI002236F955|nr:ATP synthase F0 subunit 8 [Alectorobius fonsecai]UYB78304.1 ATP synthase F0 subunit 8 [Alectorobius fonsecai]UYL27213.1 ATP synthase F0 subunit 8 [Alectorobius fonsecai]